jgi:glycosyltransferase involved in cell wall biosynthesis
MKTVSVVMCTYNGAQYLREQLDSILQQTYPIQELIVQDDCSTDNTVAIVREYMTQCPCIKLYINEHNLGYNKNFKDILMKATGDFIAISDQDDVWFPEKIEMQVNAIGQHDICFTTNFIGKDMENCFLNSPQYSLEGLLFNAFAGHTMLLQRNFVQKKENWIDFISYDWSLAISAQLNGGIVLVDKPLNWHRSHDDSAWSLENSRIYPKRSYPKYKPYLYGITNYYRLHRKKKWGMLYSYILKHANPIEHQPAYNMCKCMLSYNPFALLRLCCYCLKYRETIYPSRNVKGAMGVIRSFFYPFIFSFQNVRYE